MQPLEKHTSDCLYFKIKDDGLEREELGVLQVITDPLISLEPLGGCREAFG